MKIIFIVILSFYTFTLFSQIDKEIAVKNFETFFELFHKSYPADKNTYSFKDYSALENNIAFPEELEKMMSFDTSNFYNIYLYLVNTKMDTLIRIKELNLDPKVKKLYVNFKTSILEGEQNGQFNYQNDKMYSDSLKLLLSNSIKPQIGYFQTVTVISQAKRKRKKKSKIFIEYNNLLEVISFGNIDE